VSGQFTIQSALSDRLVQAAKEYWKSKDLAIKSVQKPAESSNDGAMVVKFVAEGGTIWTTSFETYKKTVSVTLSGNQGETEAFVHMMLPGGLMSLEDREKAAGLIEAFYETMRAHER